MQHHHIMEALEHTFQDVHNCDKSFGGVCFVFGGDFQQILPVIVKASRGQTVWCLHSVFYSIEFHHCASLVPEHVSEHCNSLEERVCTVAAGGGAGHAH